MKIFIIPLLAILGSASHAAVLFEDHVDVTYRYVPAGNSWQIFYRYGGTFDNPNLEVALENGALPVRDFLTTDPTRPGDRFVRDGNPSFNFIGAEEGSPFWNLPQGNRNYTWPGFRGAHPSSTLLSYANPDPRLNNLVRRWQAVELVDVQYSGAATDAPHFSLYSTNGLGAATLWMATSDGINASDRYFITDVSHNHVNWSFTELGIYRITFRGSAFRASDSQPIVSEPHTITVAVGTLATWRATHFSGPDIVDPEIGMPLADPDGDGLFNLIEYAFNLDPNDADTQPITAGTGLSGLPLVQLEEVSGENRLTIEFVQRKSLSNPQILYTPQFTSDLASNNWSESGTATITDIPGTDWERVKFTDSRSAGVPAKRFGRVKITLQSTINY
jgi:surface-anchored protein